MAEFERLNDAYLETRDAPAEATVDDEEKDDGAADDADGDGEA